MKIKPNKIWLIRLDSAISGREKCSFTNPSKYLGGSASESNRPIPLAEDTTALKAASVTRRYPLPYDRSGNVAFKVVAFSRNDKLDSELKEFIESG